MQISRNAKGITIIELLVVIGILAIIAVFAAPNFLSWRSNMSLRGAVNNIKGDLQNAKSSAARESARVVLEFVNNRMRIFVDDGAGPTGVKNNSIRDGSERIIRERELPVSVTVISSTFVKTHFNPRGTSGAAGTFILEHANGARMNVIVSPMGRIRIENG